MQFWVLNACYLTSCNEQNPHQKAAQAVAELMSVMLLPLHADDQFYGTCKPTALLQTNNDQAPMFVRQ